VTKLIASYGGCAVLKGHATLVASGSPDTLPWLIRAGNPGMATAGMGDVLTGITAAIYAQCIADKVAVSPTLDEIAAAAAWVHATAGDRAAVNGERGLIASDLFAELRACLNS
jgi:NAD(P)H-hydrate repair Nnr-like enzyme with NAD(P)H-hydrate dehydratase domain